MRKAAIIIPTYNEAKNVTKVIDDIIDITNPIKNWDVHIVVVDSKSPDNTGTIVEELYDSDHKKYKNLHIIHTEKEGLGKAYIEGFKVALEKLKPYILFEMDADYSHNPAKIPEFLKQIEKGSDFVIGSRYIKEGTIPDDWGIDRKFYSIVGNWILRLGFMNLKITDWTTGYRAIKAWIIEKSLSQVTNYTGYVFQVALLDNAIKMKANISEIPIQFIDRTEGESKINSGQYTFQTLWYMFQNSSFLKFVIVGLSGFVIDFSISFLFIELAHAAVWLATIISAETAIISNFMLNNFWSFKHKKLSRKSGNLVWSFLKFNLIASGSILIQTVGMTLSTNAFGREFWYIYKVLIILLVIIPYSYFFYNKLVWKD